jgi:formylglycine-generating enzyme required for sulfatase activity
MLYTTTMVRLVVSILCVVIITALGVDAADTFDGSRTTLLASLWYGSDEVACGVGMKPVITLTGSFCIDVYEVSTHADCVVQNPTSLQGSANNLADPDCVPESVAGSLPWRFVTYDQAKQLCARAGKILPSAEIWYDAALGTPDIVSACVLDQALATTGSAPLCVSGSGAYDMIGNVWEYVTLDGEQVLPESGYVAMVDEAGMPTESVSEPRAEYAHDYMWSTPKRPFVVVRGGFYGAKDDGGLYSVQGTLTRDFSSAAIGFRCARAL